MQVTHSELELQQQQQQPVFPTGSFKPLAGGLVTATLGTSGLQTLKSKNDVKGPTCLNTLFPKLLNGLLQRISHSVSDIIILVVFSLF